MADLKVKLQFNDENATSFEYDKLNGLKSLSFLNQSKTDDESIDYSVKSNTGSMSAIDIVGSRGKVEELFNSLTEKKFTEYIATSPTVNAGMSALECADIYYDEVGGFYYLCDMNKSNTYGELFKSEDLGVFSKVGQNRGDVVGKVIRVGDYLIGAGVFDLNFDGTRVFGYSKYASDGSQTFYKLADRGSNNIYQNEVPCICLKLVNGKVFACFKHTYYSDYRDVVNLYFADLDGSSTKFAFPVAYTVMWDVEYINGTYYFLTSSGVYSSTNLSTFTHIYNIDLWTESKQKNFLHFGNSLYFSYDKIYKIDLSTKSVSSYGKGIGDWFEKVGDVVVCIDKYNGIITFTSDMQNFYSTTRKFSEGIVGVALSPTRLVLATRKSIIYTNEIVGNLQIIKSLYDFLLKKPKYDKITIGVSLDGNPLGVFINSGKIGYDNDTKMINLSFQNNIVLLQNKNYKMQIDKNKIGSITLLDILNELITLASDLIGQEFEIDSATQTYLGSVNVQYPYLEEASVWEQLNKVCVAGQLVIYPAVTKIKVERWV